MGPFGRAAVGLIVSKDVSSKKKKGEDGVGTLKSGRRSNGTLPSWLKDDLPEEKPVKEGKEKLVRDGKEKVYKEKDKSRRSSVSGKGVIEEEVQMEISAPIPDEDFRLATSLLGLNPIKTRSGPLLFPASTRSGPIFAGTLQSRFGTGNDGKREEKAVNSWSKGESSTRPLSGVRKASKVHARDSVSPKDSSPAEEKGQGKGRLSMRGDLSEIDGSAPSSDSSPGSSNLKKLQRSSRIGEQDRFGAVRLAGSGLRVEGNFGDEQVSQGENISGSSWTNVDSTSTGPSLRDGSVDFVSSNSHHGSKMSPHGAARDQRSLLLHPGDVDEEAQVQESESPTSDTPKETESPRFKALLRMTGRKGKLPSDIKSFSHELDPRGVRSHEFLRPHKLGGFADLEEVLQMLRAKFNVAKEDVNAELAVFAGDLVEILERNADAAPDWQERAEDLLVLARQCALMNPQQFRKSCETIVHELDEKRQELPMGVLKKSHTRMLFILTRCSRLLQYEKRNFLELDLTRLQRLEKQWLSVDIPKKPANAKSDPVKTRKPASPPRFRPNDIVPMNWRTNVDITQPTKNPMATIKESEYKLDLTTYKDSDSKEEAESMDEVKHIVVDRLASWKKFPSAAEKAAGKGSTQSDPALKLVPSVEDQISPAKSSKVLVPPQLKRPQPQRPAEEKLLVICRICEEEVPTLHLEEHSRICAFADRCDHKGLSVDERLGRLAETLERLVESYTPKSSVVGLGGSPDTARTSNNSDPDHVLTEKLTVVSEKLGAIERAGGDLLRRGSEDMLEDLHEIDTASILDEPRVFNAIAGKTRFAPKADPFVPLLPSSVGSLLAPSSSVGSITPRSPVATPKTNQIDLLLAERNTFAELEDLQQINELADIARCIADTDIGHDRPSEYITSCMEDLKDVLEQNKVDALTVDTFGKRIDKLCREKYQMILDALGQRNMEIAAHAPEESLAVDDDMSQLKCTPGHGTHKDRTSIDDFEIIKPISRGAFGRVFLARKRITGDLFAIKVLRKADMIRKNAVESVQAERNILISVRNPFVVRFFYSFTCRENLYLVMEYLNGGDLFSLLRNLGCLEEEMARVYIAELVLALEYLHGLGVVHRDLKPDNLLIAHDGHIKLTDFGLSKVGLINSTDDLSGPTVGGATLMEEYTKHHQASPEPPQQRERRQQRSAVGTPDYLAPEILLGTSHGPAADWWSTGVILFECLTGMPPFNAEHPQVIFDNILNRNIPWPGVPEDMSYEAQDLINRLLTEDPNERLGAKGAAEVKAHVFFKNINWDTLARQKAAFVPSPDNAHDTSYFTSRHTWNSSENRVFADPGYESSDYETSASGRSTSSSETRPEDPEVVDVAGPLQRDECHNMAEFDTTPSTKFSFSNFSFKNLSQLASINYDLLLQNSKDGVPPKGQK